MTYVTGPQSAVQSAFAIFGQNPIEAESTVGFNVMTVPDSGVWTNIGDDFNVTTGFYTARYNGTYVFVLNVYKDDTINDRVYCNIRRNNIMVAIANVPNFNDFQHYHGGTGATVLSLKQVDTVSVGDCSEVSHLNYFTSFIGFLLAVDPPEEED